MDAETQIMLAKSAVSAVNHAMAVINELMEATIPWKDFREIIQVLKESKDQYSVKAAEVGGEVAKLLLDTSDSYVSSVNIVDNWCKSAVQLLEVYLNMFSSIEDKGTAEAQKQLLLTVLNEGKEALSKAFDYLNGCNEHLNTLTSKLIALHGILENDFNDKSEYFAASLKRLRIKAYLRGAAVTAMSAAFGPIAFAIASIGTVGIVEGRMVPQLKKAFQATGQKFDDLKIALEEANTVIKNARDDIKEEITNLNNITSQINTTNWLADVWAVAPKQLFVPLKKSIKDLIKTCAAYMASAENNRATNWR